MQKKPDIQYLYIEKALLLSPSNMHCLPFRHVNPKIKATVLLFTLRIVMGRSCVMGLPNDIGVHTSQ